MKRTILAALLGMTACTPAARAQTYQATPLGDIWVYENAGNPAYDPFLRTWGNGIDSVSPAFPPGGNWSYGYLKWDISALPKGAYRVNAATLTVTHKNSPGFTREQGEAAPLEAHALGTDWDEATWDYTSDGNTLPGGVFGAGDLSEYATATAFNITINLLQSGDFPTYFNTAVNTGGHLALATASTLDPGVQGGAAIYKFYSKDDPGGRGPVLTVSYAPVTIAGTIFSSVSYPHTGGIPLDSVTVEYRAPGTTTTRYTQSVMPSSTDGSFTLTAPQIGKFDLAFKSPKTLRIVLPDVDTTNANVAGLTVTLPGGNANDDDAVDIADFGLLVNAYGSDVTDTGSGYDASADFNYDGLVDIADFGILVNNYGRESMP